jgi:hypothetical protein
VLDRLQMLRRDQPPPAIHITESPMTEVFQRALKEAQATR